MGDWIDALGSDEEKRRKSEELHTQSQFHRAEIIRQKKDALWASLIAVVGRDVEKFRMTFKGQTFSRGDYDFTAPSSPFQISLPNGPDGRRNSP